jgi:acyl-CoA thioesterase FadM
VTAIGRSSFTLVYDIVHTQSRRAMASGSTVMVSYDYAAGKPMALPDTARLLLEELMRNRGR